MALATSWSVRGLLYPLSVVKSRLQLQKQNNVYSGMRHAFVDIVRNEGMVALYRGFWITLPQLIGTRCIRLGRRMCQHFHSVHFRSHRYHNQHMMIHNNPAKFVGSSQNIAVLDFVRTDCMAKRLTLGLRIIRAVYHVDGIRGFYRGFLSSLMLYIPSSMVFWSVYYNSLALLKRGITRICCYCKHFRVHSVEFNTGPKDKLLGNCAASGAKDDQQRYKFLLNYDWLRSDKTALCDARISWGRCVMSALATRAFPSRAERVRQWMLFSRQWHVIDADRQDIWKLAKKVAKHLSGWWKPIHHPHTDCGDHVVVVNCTDASMHAFDWKHTHFFFDRQYPKSKFDIPAYQIHEYDPCRVVWMCIGRELAFLTRNRIVQRRCYERLHVFPDLEMPDFVRKNINNQLRQVQDVPRKSTEYTSEERAAFPRIFRPDDNFLKDWEEPIEPERWHPHERLKRGEEHINMASDAEIRMAMSRPNG
uniref:Uncharacterized protein n=1 Tax=Globodera rostochiensis TaxID=31243 RepID=A0A914IEN1_GLORO